MATSTLQRLAISRPVNMASRGLAALIGGYLLTFGVTAFLSVYLPLTRPDRVVTASLLCFAVWVAAAIYAFAARNATRAWLGLILAAAILSLAGWLPGNWRLRP